MPNGGTDEKEDEPEDSPQNDNENNMSMEDSLEENDEQAQAISPRDGSSANLLFAAAAILKEKGSLPPRTSETSAKSGTRDFNQSSNEYNEFQKSLVNKDDEE